MRNTFYSWLIANMECIAVVVAFICVVFSSMGDGESLVDVQNQEVVKASIHPTIGLTLLGLTALLTLISSVVIAIFTWRNFDEVVSRRTLFRNSNSALFSMRLLYTCSRFATAFVIIGFGLWMLLGLIGLFD